MNKCFFFRVRFRGMIVNWGCLWWLFVCKIGWLGFFGFRKNLVVLIVFRLGLVVSFFIGFCFSGLFVWCFFDIGFWFCVYFVLLIFLSVLGFN